MTTPEEEARKKSAEAKAKEPEKSSAPANDALSVIGQLFGDGKNLAVDALSGTHSGDKVLSSISPELAARYQLGKEVQARLASHSVTQNQLNESDRKNLEAFNSVRKSISQVPLYDRDSLTRYVEKGIQQKAKSAPPEAAQPIAAKDGTIHKTSGKQAEHSVHKEAGDPKTSATHPSQSARKDVPTSSAPGVSVDAKATSQKPSQPIRSQDHSDVRPQDRGDTSSQVRGETGSQGRRDTSSQDREDSRSQDRSDSRFQDRTDLHAFESKASVSKYQSDFPAGIEQGDVKSEGQRNPLLSDKKEVKLPELGAQHANDTEHAKLSELSSQRVGETGARQTQQRAYDVTAQGFNVFRSDSFVSNSFREAAQSINTFERRTGYDARVNQEAKQNQYGRNIETRNQNQEQKLSGTTQSLQGLSVQRDAMVTISPPVQRAFENMRRILDERTSMANAPGQKSRVAEPIEIKSTGSSETRDAQRHLPVAERKVSLSEIRNNLSEHRVQQIVRISEERFPAGLRWQNTIRQADTAPGAGKVRPTETPTTNVPVKGVDRGTGNVSIRPGMPGEVSQSTIGQSSIVPAKVLSFNGRVTDRYITGAEIALAAIIAAAGAKRIRFDEILPGADIGNQTPRVQKIQAFLPHKSVTEKVTPRTDGPKFDQRRPDVPTIDIKSNSSQRQLVLRQETFTSTFRPSEKRFVTGVEVALAAIIASCGTARIRQNFSEAATDKHPGIAENLVANEHAMEEEALKEETSAVRDSTFKDANEKTSKAQQSAERELSDDNIPGTLRYLQTHKFNRRTILIGTNDTFVSIADRELTIDYGNLGWLIADVNLNRIKETYLDGKRIVEVRSRQTIEIPSADDIIAFLRHRKKENKAENLITIVVETQLDRELLNEHLGVFVDREEKTPGLLPKYENL